MRNRMHRDAASPPQTCPTCGYWLGNHPYYQLRPGRFARLLRSLAVGLLPVMGILAIVSLVFWVPLDYYSGASGYFLLAVATMPSLLLYSISRLFPKERRVLCLRCSWYEDYPDDHRLIPASPG